MRLRALPVSPGRAEAAMFTVCIVVVIRWKAASARALEGADLSRSTPARLRMAASMRLRSESDTPMSAVTPANSMVASWRRASAG